MERKMQDTAASEKTEQASLFEEEPGGAASNRLALFEDCAAAIDQLFAQALETQGLGAFDDFLGFMQRFNNLSVYNAMLVRVQRPGAAAVGSRRQWTGYGRRVRPDAVPIVVLQPFGHAVHESQAHRRGEGAPLLRGRLGLERHLRAPHAMARLQHEVGGVDLPGAGTRPEGPLPDQATAKPIARFFPSGLTAHSAARRSSSSCALAILRSLA